MKRWHIAGAMKRLFTTPILFALLSLMAAGGAVAVWAAPVDAAESEASAETQRASSPEMFSGRRLSAEELAELREQVRAQWSARSEAIVSSGESQPAQRPLLPVQNRGTAQGWHSSRP